MFLCTRVETLLEVISLSEFDDEDYDGSRDNERHF